MHRALLRNNMVFLRMNRSLFGMNKILLCINQTLLRTNSARCVAVCCKVLQFEFQGVAVCEVWGGYD